MSSSTATPSPAEIARRTLLWCAVALCAGVIFWFSSKPGSQIPSRFSEVGHFGEYFLFGAALFAALRQHMSARDAAALAIVIASAYGVSDEFHQHFVVGRTPDVLDWAMDTVGATTGALFARLLGKLARRQ
jgi:VanZ family protein